MASNANLVKVLGQLNKQIRKDNHKFKKMTAAQKRVQIAKDVLVQIKKRRIRPTQGIYVNSQKLTDTLYEMEGKDNPVKADDELQDLFKQMPSCDACALGSMFVCAVDKFDKLKVKDAVNGAGLTFFGSGSVDGAIGNRPDYYLKRFFSTDQMNAIEDAFEAELPPGWTAYKRLKRIMENIIENKGKFIPTERVYGRLPWKYFQDAQNECDSWI